MGFALQNSFLSASPINGGGDNGDVFALSASAIFAVWLDYNDPFTEQRVMFSKSADGGGTWTTPSILYFVNPSTSGLESLQVSTLDGTNIIVSCIQFSNNPQVGFGSPGALRVSVSANGGTSWTNTSPDVDQDTYYISQGCDLKQTTGRIFIAYNTFAYNAKTPDANRNKFARSDDGGATWTFTTLPAVGNYGSGTPLLTAAGSVLSILYDDDDYSSYIGYEPSGALIRRTTWVIKSTDNGASWSTPISVFTSIGTPPADKSSAMGFSTLDGSTFFAMVKKGTSTAEKLDLYRSTDGGTTWTLRGNIRTNASTNSVGIVPSLLQANNSELVAVYRITSSITEWSATTDAGATWPTPTTLQAAGADGGYSSISGVGPSAIWIYVYDSSVQAAKIYNATSAITGAFLAPTAYSFTARSGVDGKQLKSLTLAANKIKMSGQLYDFSSAVALRSARPVLTADVVNKGYADGLVLFTATTPEPVSSTGAVGVATTLSRSDHVHDTPLPSNSNKFQNPAASAGADFFYTGLTIAATPALDSYVLVDVNGSYEEVGNGVKTKIFYYSSDLGVTAKTWANIAAADRLYFNAAIAGYDTSATDLVSQHYLVF